MTQTKVVAFVKDSGFEPVKTRLGATVGDVSAQEFYQLCLQILRLQLCELQEHGLEVIVALSSETPSRNVSQIFEEFSYCKQGTGSIGNRINYVDAFLRKNNGEAKIIFMGSDAPTLPSKIIYQVVEALDWADAAVSPAEDGGFTVLGSSRMLPDFGNEVRWSHSQTCQDTVRFLKFKNYNCATVEAWHDVDEWKDLFAVETYLCKQENLSKLHFDLLEFTRKLIYQKSLAFVNC
jgi:hypothetical protein